MLLNAARVQHHLTCYRAAATLAGKHAYSRQSLLLAQQTEVQTRETARQKSRG